MTVHLQTPLSRTVLAGWHTHAAPTKAEFAGQLQSPAVRGRPDVHLQVCETESNAESAVQWQTPFVSQAPDGHGQVRPTANALGARGSFEIPEKEIPLWETDPAPVTLKTKAHALAAPFMIREKRIVSMETAAWASQTRPYTSFPERAPERLMFLIERASVWTSTSAQPFKEVAWKANEEFSMWQAASWCARPKKVSVWVPATSNLVWFRTSLVFILKVRPQNAESASYWILTETAKSSRSKSVLQLRMPRTSLCWPFLSLSSTRESWITRSVMVMKKSEKLELARSTSASIRNWTTGVWVVRKMEFVVLLHKVLGSGSSKVTAPVIICPAPMGSSQMKLQQQLNSAIEVTCCCTLIKQLSINGGGN
ncbi:Hypothetical_protein [Hexamita inflata]|uniref:Hypothetical_protein n=1 Tax=Hexamita inflata TaxID=28002 RepID=A0AA86TNN7_9EUKA|nr:Hypothetical protein HINF_LOCUS10756 [Hexamita inflata]CAI9923487.1 Hypothetical protein HINF_LOCUS11132 [Hexamita inflata]